MQKESFNNITQLVEKYMGKYKFELNRNTSLEKDIGLTGDDAVEFMLEYSKNFKVDLSLFEISKYFYPEGDAFLSDLVNSITKKKGKKQGELTLGDLEKGVIAGRLDENVINSID